ncbi:TetR/AcrR family transcriptional regulator [Streptosporangium sp. NPDC000396]|uniref:TetR/AcrR family transcriptional regulator n=1 Tax=Streptosporangium sp. NPDC000396 TaxID=3366185 RepID=UPI00368C029E
MARSEWQESVALHKQQVRERIARSALVLAVEHGLPSVTMGALAEHAEVSRATAYNYFPDVEHALLHAVEAEVTRFVDTVLNSVADPAARLRAYLGAQMSYFAEPERRLCALHFRSAGLSPVVRERVHAHTVRLEEIVTGILADGRAAGMFRKDLDPGRTAALVVHLLTGAREQVMRGNVEPQVLTEELISFIERGIRSAA